VLPLYETLAQDKPFASRLARDILRHDAESVDRLIRARIRTPSLRAVTIEDDGIVLTFTFPFSRFPYQHVLFREIIEPDGGGE